MAWIESMMTLILTALVSVWIVYGGSHLHKHEHAYYVGFSLVSLTLTVFSVLFQQGIMTQPDNLLYPIFFQGHLALAFYLPVMFAGAFKHKSTAKITLLKVRRELAVIGFLMVIPHATLLIISALSALNPTGTIAVFLMVPLVITSFPVIRRKFSRDGWLGFHKWAYITYGLIYIHIASITVIAQTPATNAYEELWWVRLLIYTLIFVSYLGLKLFNYTSIIRLKKIS